MIKSKGLGKNYRKVTITLDEEHENIIDDLRKKIRKKSGYSLGRTEIIRTAVQLLKFLKLDKMNLSKVKEENDLLDILKNYAFYIK